MTRNELNVALSAVLTTALEIQPCPESAVYLALGSDMSKWEQVKSIMTVAHLATFKGHSVTLTERGVALANQCNAALASAR